MKFDRIEIVCVVDLNSGQGYLLPVGDDLVLGEERRQRLA